MASLKQVKNNLGVIEELVEEIEYEFGETKDAAKEALNVIMKKRPAAFWTEEERLTFYNLAELCDIDMEYPEVEKGEGE